MRLELNKEVVLVEGLGVWRRMACDRSYVWCVMIHLLNVSKVMGYSLLQSPIDKI